MLKILMKLKLKNICIARLELRGAKRNLTKDCWYAGLSFLTQRFAAKSSSTRLELRGAKRNLT